MAIQTRLHQLVDFVAATRPSAPALTYRNTTLSYAELQAAARAIAGGIRRLGLEPADRIAIYLDKRVETVVAVLGVSGAGCAFVPANPLLKPMQVGYVADHCGARLFITTTSRFLILRDELRACKALRHVVVIGELPDADANDTFTLTTWDMLAAAGAGEAACRDGVDTEIGAILYTSGSTGRPKGVVLSHRNLIVGAHSVSDYLGNTADDRILSVLPLSFDAGLSQLTTTFAVGAHVVLVNYLLPGEVVALCERHRITGLTCVPPLWMQLAERHWPEAATGHMRYFANTGGRMPRSTLGKLRAVFPAAAPYLMYGLTEAFRSTYLDPDQVDRRPDSIGKAIPNAEVLVVRPDGSLCDPDEEGELVHRGPLVAMGYWNDPVMTAERFRPVPGRPAELCLPEPAVWSGDIVRRDLEGFLYFVGRSDDMIKTSGYRVSPTEVEEVVFATGLVRDAVALGIDDERLGQRIVLVVSPLETDGGGVEVEMLLGRLRAELPTFMVPSRVEVMASVPRSPNGKFDRPTLRLQFEGSR